jgi:hypothetical protein
MIDLNSLAASAWTLEDLRAAINRTDLNTLPDEWLRGTAKNLANLLSDAVDRLEEQQRNAERYKAGMVTLGDLLAPICATLKGPAPPNGLHDWSDLPALVQQQAAEIERLKGLAPAWIPVSERLPPDWQEVMIWPRSNDESVTTALIRNTKSNPANRWMYASDIPHHGIEWYDCNPTHWQPLPSAPTGDNPNG